MNKLILFSLVLLYRHVTAQNPLSLAGPLAGFIQTNFVGKPVIHNQQTWIFDPDVAQRRRRQFIAVHGDKGDKLIERLGLGIDGRDEERLAKQRQRDEGHLGGKNFYLP